MQEDDGWGIFFIVQAAKRHQMPQSGKEAICCDRATIGAMALARNRPGSEKRGEVAGQTLVGGGEAKSSVALRPLRVEFLYRPAPRRRVGDDAREDSVSESKPLDVNPTVKRELSEIRT
jgi:hypothetical protein